MKAVLHKPHLFLATIMNPLNSQCYQSVKQKVPL
jgi:hypothetical protein